MVTAEVQRERGADINKKNERKLYENELIKVKNKLKIKKMSEK